MLQSSVDLECVPTYSCQRFSSALSVSLHCYFQQQLFSALTCALGAQVTEGDLCCLEHKKLSSSMTKGRVR